MFLRSNILTLIILVMLNVPAFAFGTGELTAYQDNHDLQTSGVYSVNGNVGIGTINPGQKLDVAGTVRAMAFVGNGAGLTGVLSTSQWTTTNTVDVYLSKNGNVGIGTTITNQSALSIMNGNVGIGTWVPGSLLVIGPATTFLNQVAFDKNGDITAGGYGTFNNINLINGIIEDPGEPVQIGDPETEATGETLTIGYESITLGIYAVYTAYNTLDNGYGNVGIGILSPSQALDVKGTVRMTSLSMTGGTLGNGYVFVSNSVGLGTWMPASTLPASGQWTTTNAKDVYQNLGGNVGIGTTITNQSAFTVMNGNVGIGTWVPGELFEVGSLGVNSDVQIDNSGDIVAESFNVYAGIEINSTQIEQADGLEIGDPNGELNGLYLSISTSSFSFVGLFGQTIVTTANNALDNGAGNVGIGTLNPFGGGLIILPAKTGNVGIGTLIPSQALDVAGTVRMTSLSMTGGTIGNGYVMVANSVGLGTWMPVASLGASGSSQWTTTNTRDVYNNLGGNVGIGTTITNQSALSIMNGNVGIGTWVPTGSFEVKGSSQNVYITSSGNIGIGTNAPTAPLQVGYGANSYLNFGNSNSFFGYQAGYQITGSQSTAIGYGALSSANSNGGNTAIGYGALENNISGSDNVAIGPGTMIDNSTGSNNTVVGYHAMGLVSANTATDNSSFGYDSLIYITTGHDNIAVGMMAGGPGGITGTSTGSYNVWLGANAGPSGASDVSNSVGIGSYATAGANNVIVLGGMGVNALNVGIGTDMNGAKGSLIVLPSGNANGNVGIGSITPGQALDVKGTARMTSLSMTGGTIGNGYVMVANSVGLGTWMPVASLGASSGSSQWTTTNTNDVYETAGGNVGIGTTITNQSALSVMNGNVGIGTWLPNNALTVNGSITPISSTSGSLGTLTEFWGWSYIAGMNVGDSSINSVGSIQGGNAANFNLTSQLNFSIDLLPAGTGNVGIGTSAPVGLLDVEGSFYPTVFYGRGTNLNVGIGSFHPGQALDVTGTVRMTSLSMTGGTIGNGYIMVANSVGLGTWMPVNSLGASGSSLWTTTNTNDVYETAGGNVGIGTTITNQSAFTVMNGNVGIGTWVPRRQFDVEGTLSVSTFGGNVGIGTLAPGYNIDIAGSGRYSTSSWEKVKLVTTGVTAPARQGSDQNGLNFTTNALWNGSAWSQDDSTKKSFAYIQHLGNGRQEFRTSASGGSIVWVYSLILDDIGATFEVPLNIDGGMVIGSSYTGNTTTPVYAAPPNGLIVQGNVGIGSTNPGQTLDVTGTIRTTNFAMSGQGPLSGYVLTASDSYGDTTWSSPGSSSGWTMTNTTDVYETKYGNVGIGTTITNQSALSVMNGNVGIGTWVPTGTLDIKAGNADLENGNLGIGTTLPDAGIDIANGSNTGFHLGEGLWTNNDLFYIYSHYSGSLTSDAMSVLGFRYAINLSGSSANKMIGVEGIGQGFSMGAGINLGWTVGVLGEGDGTAGTNPGTITNSASLYAADAGRTGMTNEFGLYLENITQGTNNYSIYSAGGQSYFAGNVGIGTLTPLTPFEVNGSLQNVYVMSTGNVGIGTNNAAEPLDVYIPTGNSLATIESGSVATAAILYKNQSKIWQVGLNAGSGAGDWIVFDQTNSIRRLDIAAAGNVGIGTFAMSSQFVVNGGVGIGNTSTYTNDNSAPTGGMIVKGNVGIGTFNPFGGQLIVPTTNGNVGIGSLVPGQALDVAGTVRMTSLSMTGGTIGNGYVMVANSVGLGTWMPVSSLGASGSSQWTTTNTNDVYETAGGNVGVGTTITNQGALTVMNGNVGIGTWAPTAALHVADTTQGASNYDVWAGPTYFADLGNWITSPNMTKDIFTEDAGTAVGSVYNALLGWTRASAADATGGATGLIGEVTISNPTGTFLGGEGVVGAVNISAAGNQSVATAFVANLSHAGAGTLSNAYGVTIDSFSNTAGSITNAYSVYSYNQSAATNNFNIFLNQSTTGATNYSIYSAGAAKSYFAGNIGLNTTNPGQILDVAGTVRMTSLSMTGGTIGNGYVMVANSVGVGTWMPASSLGASSGSQWTTTNTNDVYETAGGNVGVGTTITNQSALSVMNGNVGIGTWVPVTPFQVNGSTQNVYIASNGNIGIGTWVPKAALHVADTTQGASNFDVWAGPTYFADLGAWVTGNGITKDIFTEDAGAATNVYYTALLGWTRLTTAGTNNSAIGTIGEVTISNPTGTLYGGTGVIGEVDVNAAGNQTSAWALGANISHAGTGTLTNAFGLYVGAFTKTAGTITNTYGIETVNQSVGTNNYNVYISQTTPGATNYSLYSAGAAKSYFAGNIGLNSTNPGQILDVAGTIRATSFTMSGQSPLGGYVLTASDSYGDTTWSAAGGVSGWTITNTTDVYETAGGNVGIGTTITNQSALSVMNGNVGIGTWVPVTPFQVNGSTQNVYIASNGNIGIGTWVPKAALHVADTTQGASNFDIWAGPTYFADLGNWVTSPNMTKDVFTEDAGTTTNAGYLALLGWTRVNAAGTNNNTGGIIGEVTISNPSGTLFSGTGVIGEVDINAAGNQTDAFSLGANISHAGTGTLTNAFGLYVAAFTRTAGTITNTYGIDTLNQSVGSNNYNVYINQTTTGANDYSIYSAGAAKSYFAGNIGLNSTNPGQILDVAGTIRATSFTMSGQSPIGGYVLTASDSYGDTTWSAAGGVSGWTITNTTDVYETAGGNVGIGTTMTTHAGLSVMNGNVGIGTWLPTGVLDVEGTLSKAMFGGLVSIGQPYPVAKLEVLNTTGTTGTNTVVANFKVASTNLGGSTILRVSALTTNDYSDLETNEGGTGPFQFGTYDDTNILNSLQVSSGAYGNINFVTGNAGGSSVVMTIGGGTQKGNVGIGSLTPGQALDVAGTARMTSLSMTGGTIGNGYVMVANSVGLGTWMPVSSLGASGSSQWTTTNTKDVYQNLGGNVGIGTTITNQSAFAVMNGNVGIGTWVPRGQLDIEGASSVASFGGNVGIGSNAPAQKLDVEGSIYVNGNVGIGSISPVTQLANTPTAISDFNSITVAPTGFTWSVPASGASYAAAMYENGGSPGNRNVLLLKSLSVDNGSYLLRLESLSAPLVGFTASGNVGIGTMIPAGKLDIEGALPTIINGQNQAGGNVGIGTWVASSPLTVEGGVSSIVPGAIANYTAYNPLTGYPRAQYQVGNSTSDTNVGMYLSPLYSSNGTQIPSYLVVSTDKTITDSNEEEIAIGITSTYAVIQSNQKDNTAGGVNGEPLILTTQDSISAPPVPGIYIGNTSTQNIGIGTTMPSGGLIVMNGNMGIGTWVPGQALDVKGVTRTTSFTMSGQSPLSGYVLTATDTLGDTTWSTPGSVSDWTITNTRDVYETAGGNVGIGTTITNQSAFTVMNGNVGIGTWVPGSLLEVQGTLQNFYVNSVGNVGIGTWVPTAALHVADTTQGASNYDIWSGPTGFTDLGNWITGGAIAKNVFTLDASGTNAASDSTLLGWGRISVANNSSTFGISGIVGEATVQNASGTVNLAEGIQGEVDINAAGNETSAIAVEAQVNRAGTGTLTSAINLFSVSTGNTGGTISYVEGFFGENQSAGTNNYNVAIKQTTTGPNNYSLFSSGMAKSYFAGNVGIGTQNGSPAATLSIEGNIGIGTVAFGDNFLTNSPPNGGMIVEGNVGIGTWVPQSLLDVVGTGATLLGTGNLPINISSNGNNTYSGFDIYSPSNISQYFAFALGGNATTDANRFGLSTVNGAFIYANNGGAGGPTPSELAVGLTTDAPLYFANNNLVRLTIASGGGNVGIGTLWPAGRFQVSTPSTYPFLIDANGNVGIGSINPVGALDASNGADGGGANAPHMIFGDYGTNVDPQLRLYRWTGLIGPNFYSVGIAGSLANLGDLEFQTGPAYPGTSFGAETMNTRMTILINGNVGIGNTNPGQNLDVTGTVRMTFLSMTGGTSGNGYVMVSNSVGLGTWMPINTISAGAITSASANQIAYYSASQTLNGSPSMVFVSPNVGIGTANPGQRLDVAGVMRTTNFTMSGQSPISGYVLTASDTLGDTTWAPGGGWTITNTNDVYQTKYGNVGIGTTITNTGSALSVMNGNVGIGTWVVQNAALSVNVSSASIYNIALTNTTEFTGISFAPSTTFSGISYDQNNQYLVLDSNSFGAQFVLRSSGNIGIGSMVPSQLLDVQGTVRMTSLMMTGGTIGNGYVMVANSVGIGTWMSPSSIGASGSGGGQWTTTNTSDIFQNLGGNVGIGTTITNQSAFTVMNGNVGIGTWVSAKPLQVVGNVGIGTTTVSSSPYTLTVNNIVVFNSEYDNGSQSSSFTINWAKGNKQKVTLANTGLTANFTNPTTGVGNFQLKVVEDGIGSRTITTWTPSAGSILWAGGSAPTLTTTPGKADIITCYYDGTNYYCSATLNF